MAYPSPPWQLQGQALILLYLLEIERSRPWVAAELAIVPVLPGLTLGGVLVAAYTPGSVMAYSELIIVPALVRYGRSIGFWISHIYVDQPDSVAGGRAIWGLPKQMAAFTWSEGAIAISQPERDLCSVESPAPWLSLPAAWQPALTGQVFCQIQAHLARFESQFQGQVHLTKAQLSVPASSPFAELLPGQPWLAVAISDLQLRVQAPKIIDRSPVGG
ncbi:acetoacetate decarboxylase [filamentous cyanobacterium CCP5]|nr:acetoacetate decarboxylase [filamentous cyanobacterium CCP5]